MVRSTGSPSGPGRPPAVSASAAARLRSIRGRVGPVPIGPFALIGDDSQGDLTAFADVAASNPGRVRAVFIRKVGEAMSPEELAAKQSLKSANIPLWLGEGYEEGRKFLASIGLLEDDEAQNVVKSVGKGETEAA